MGFSFRGRTKGNTGWINYSVSKNGPRASVSTKFGKATTVNFSRDGIRATFNFGHGIRWTGKTGGKSRTKVDNSISPYIEGDLFRIFYYLIAMPIFTLWMVTQFNSILMALGVMYVLVYGTMFIRGAFSEADPDTLMAPLLIWVTPIAWILLAFAFVLKTEGGRNILVGFVNVIGSLIVLAWNGIF